MNVHRLQRPRIDPEPLAVPRPRRRREIEAPRFGIGAVFRIFLARRLTIIVTALVGASVAGGAITQMTPIYRASALVVVGDRVDATIAKEPPAIGLTKEAAAVETQVQILRSPSLAQAVVARLNLTRDPEFGPDADSPLDGLNPQAWIDNPAPKIPTGTSSTLDTDVLKRFAAHLSVGAEGPSSVARVTFTSADPAKAAQVANAIVEQYLKVQAGGTPEPTTDATSDETLRRLTDQVRTAEDAVARYKGEDVVGDAKDGNALVAEQVSELNAQIAEARSSLAEREAKHRQASAILRAGGNADAMASLTKSPQLTRLIDKQTDLAGKEAELSLKYGARHPQMIALRNETDSLDTKIADEVRRTVKNLAGAVSAAKARLTSLETSLSEMQGAPAAPAAPEARAATLRELEDELASRRAALAQYKATVGSAEAGPRPTQAKSISPAIAPREPTPPDTPMIMGGTLFASTLIGMLFALIMERLDKAFRTGAEIERMAGVSNLAVVPQIKGERHVADRIVQKPMSAYSEAVRSLYSGLQLSSPERPPKVVVMTSSLPHEGKTSLAVSLGRLASKGGARVILLDGDLRHPSVGSQFSPRRPEAGLAEVLNGVCKLRDVLHRDPISPLEFVPVAAPPPNPSDLLASHQMKDMLDVLRKYYDLIIIDAAPVLPVSDTRLLSRVADKMIYVVGWDTTPREAVMSGLRLLDDAGADIAGTVLNQADMRRHALYSYGVGSYGYGTKYTRYHAE